MTPTMTPTPTPTPTSLPTFSIVPDKLTINEGETVTYTITTTRFTGSTLYVSNSGTAVNADLNFLFSSAIPLVGGTATFTISALNDIVYEGPETIIVNLRTGSTTGPIVATASTVTINNTTPQLPVYETSTSYSQTIYGVGTTTLTVPATALKMDNRRHKFVLQATDMSVPGGYTSTSVILNSVTITSRTTTGTNTVEVRVPTSSTCSFSKRINPGYLGTASLKIYPQTDASFIITGIQALSLPAEQSISFSQSVENQPSVTRTMSLTFPSDYVIEPGKSYSVTVKTKNSKQFIAGYMKVNNEYIENVTQTNSDDNSLVFTPRSFTEATPNLAFDLIFKEQDTSLDAYCILTPV
jgi:hypothetical protein